MRIDGDRAAASLGSQAERTLTGSISLNQVLYSDQTRAGVAIQRHLQFGREVALDQLRLDISLDAAVTYLNLMRAKSLERVQRNNLELTRSNLELARIRRSIGSANPAEVFRWESRIASDRKALIEADADVWVAEIAVNRLLHRDLEERFVTDEVDLNDPSFHTGEDRFSGYIETPRHFRVFRDFMVEEGLFTAPELRQLQASIAAQERAVLAARRSFWSPTVAARLTFDELLAEGGEGSGDSSFSTLPISLPVADDTDWSVAVSASLPLFTGGLRRAERIQAAEDLARLGIELDAASERIEQRVRSAMHATRASFSGIRLAREAEEAAAKNLSLVADAYARGAVSILDLLDAQNAALNADQLAANALYDFFIDLMEVERAANRFEFFVGPEERNDWYARLDRFFADAGVVPLKEGRDSLDPRSVDRP